MKTINAIINAAKKPGNLLLVALFLFVSLTCSYAQLPKDTSSINDYYAGSTFDTLNVLRSATPTPFATRFVTIVNDGVNTTDTLWIWFNNDSTSLKFYLLPRQAWNKNMLLKSINTRSGGSGTIRRRIIVKGQ